MTTAPIAPPIVPAGSINPDAQYHLKLLKPVQWDAIILLPRHDHVVSGKVLAAIMEGSADAVYQSAAV